jgi:acyl carrier protein
VPPVIVTALIEHCGLEEDAITQDAILVQDLGLDSLDVVELAMELEHTLKIQIGDEVLESWITVRDVIKTVARGTR